MNHAAAQFCLSDYLEGDLSLSERHAMDSHLSRCDVCTHELEALRRTVLLLHSLPTPEPPLGLVEAVMRRVREGEGGRTWRGRLHAGFANFAAAPIAVPASALAALALVVVVAGLPDLPLRLSSLWEQVERKTGTGQVADAPDTPSAPRLDSGMPLRSKPVPPAPAPVRIDEVTRLWSRPIW